MTTTAKTDTLAHLPVKITYAGTGRTDGWEHDRWTVEFKDKQGYWTTEYKTGLGLRKKMKFGAADRPVMPTVADVMYSLLSDSDCSNSNFVDFCADLGYSDDSIKALNIYKACCETAVALRKYLTPEQIAEARKATEGM